MMNQYVVILSIGPVQSMIASARRNRDLWSGSWLLSELAKAGAKVLYETTGVELIFPHIQNADFLQANSDFSVGNKLQAVIKENNPAEVEGIIQKVKTAVLNRFRQEAQSVFNRLKNQNDIRKDIWYSQIEDFVEVQSAWAKIVDGEYTNAIALASKVLAARKATREFNPLATDPYQTELMIPKSSLDGLRETVLKEDEVKNGQKISKQTHRQLSLAKSEQLDAVGVIKRLGFGEKVRQFTPISRLMANAWIKNLITGQVDLTGIKDTCEQLVQLGVMTRVTGNEDIYKDFAYDAQLLYPSRIDAEIGQWQGYDDAVVDWLKLLKKQLVPLWKQYGEPCAYGALLLADGDRMGELLDKAKKKEQHQAITAALSGFAESVAETMRDHQGHCIYAGGDDVLGFVPLNTAYQCADGLRSSFADSLRDISEDLGMQDSQPTLSVGIAICHLMTPLGIIRELAGRAEKYAKGDHISKGDEKNLTNERRNALGILLSVRGGSDIYLRFNWSDQIGLDTFGMFINFYLNNDIPSRVAYDIREIYLRTVHFAPDDKELRKKIRSAELRRMLKQARTPKGHKICLDIVEKLVERSEQVDLNQLADELIVARWLAAKTQKDLGKQ